MPDLCRILYNGSLVKLYHWVKMSWKNKFDFIEVITNKARVVLAFGIKHLPLPTASFTFQAFNY